jgi:hypothetical protein
MALEAQATSEDERSKAIDDLAVDLVRRGHNVWQEQP